MAPVVARAASGVGVAVGRPNRPEVSKATLRRAAAGPRCSRADTAVRFSPSSQAQRPTRALIYVLVGGVQPMKVGEPLLHSAIKRMWGHKLWSRGSLQLLHSTPNPSPIEGALPAAGSSATKSERLLCTTPMPTPDHDSTATPSPPTCMVRHFYYSSTLSLSLSFSGSMNTMSLFTPNASIYSLIRTYNDLKNSTMASELGF
jgi:hypothetical protein